MTVAYITTTRSPPNPYTTLMDSTKRSARAGVWTKGAGDWLPCSSERLRLGGGWFVVVGSTPIGSVYRLGDAWSTVSRGTHPALGARVHSPQGPLNWHSTRAQPARERVRTGSSTCVGQDRKTRPSHYPDTSNTHTPTPWLPPYRSYTGSQPPHTKKGFGWKYKRVWVGIWVCPQNHQVLGARSPLTHQTPHKRGIGWVCPAASYSPTHSRVQYHRRYEA